MQRITRAELDKRALFETHLIFGPTAVGKTSAILSIARQFPNNTLRVIDTDGGYEKIAKEVFSEIENFEIFECDSMKDVVEAWDLVVATAAPDDWLGIDLIDTIWEYAQNAWALAQHGTPYIMEYLMEKQRTEPIVDDKRKPIFGMDQFETWPAINFMHNYLFADKLKRPPCNIVAAAGLRDMTGKESEEIKSIFKGVRALPGGQKNNAYRFDTINLLGKDVTGKQDIYYMSTLKDRARPLFKDMPWFINKGYWSSYQKGLESANPKR
jgi:hypothetical protein